MPFILVRQWQADNSAGTVVPVVIVVPVVAKTIHTLVVTAVIAIIVSLPPG